MKKLDSIPTGKLQRATKFISTGAKVGINYLKYNVEKTVGDSRVAKENLDKSNAEDIYDSLKDLKGSALKVAQMLSMEKSILPRAYVEKFSLSQFSVPPLSSALVLKTFRKYYGKSPNDLYDSFDFESVNAASIGQVHKATLNGKKLAVKIQYPGVAQSISSDLALVKPIAIKMFNIQGEGSDKYFKEVEDKLIEETNYILEVQQSIEISEACQNIPNLKFPKYYPELSSDRIITMDWMDGVHLSELDLSTIDEQTRTKIGQAFWDFYMYQIHVLKKVHADPHPGNFMVSEKRDLIALDFGCTKVIPNSFYIPYFELANPEVIGNPQLFKEKLYDLEILTSQDNAVEIDFFTKLFHELLSLFTQPFHGDSFDFSDETFFWKIASLGERFNNDPQLKKMNGNRGSKHFIYMNRTFFGLYNLMHDLKSKNIIINNYKNY
ncbi:AarF/ABC1/UbiB kinase family protein [Wenyingzhuangia sp. 2_MG-2023]|uniref:ABC1 kinase family protein n=1 Tax=Wenyingzhuangia sp. 2_MG-2023 TaxID=3062639 RepID=UPI0026E287BF|nr:lipopolysaccharide core heptose(II) kinase RfaY [Wenyingzhuangia sp. 2_MG-2023]MDO6737196.1 lipopolysaccharide core heptose(II) kinase RfaY [Wenyingzhuangia sp. 2_MG-2023]